MTDKTPIKLSYQATKASCRLIIIFPPIPGTSEWTHLDIPEGRFSLNERKWHPLLLTDIFSLVNYRLGGETYAEHQQFTSSPLISTTLVCICLQIAHLQRPPSFFVTLAENYRAEKLHLWWVWGFHPYRIRLPRRLFPTLSALLLGWRKKPRRWGENFL